MFVLDFIFKYLFIGRWVELKVLDLFGVGFLVIEKCDVVVFVLGMIVLKMELWFVDGLCISCMVQVIYWQVLQDILWVRCGLVLLDMDSWDYVYFMVVFNQIKNLYIYFCNDIDVDVFWEFFFESGFIYFEKYVYI